VFGKNHDLKVPAGYVSGSPLSGTSTWSSSTFDSLGMTKGTYVWSWGAGALGAGDTLTLIVDADAVPEPTAAALALTALCLTISRRRIAAR
jgi:hypothetical protein